MLHPNNTYSRRLVRRRREWAASRSSGHSAAIFRLAADLDRIGSVAHDCTAAPLPHIFANMQLNRLAGVYFGMPNHAFHEGQFVNYRPPTRYMDAARGYYEITRRMPFESGEFRYRN
jgi:hypothetical protein